jgi:hypothetical protein
MSVDGTRPRRGMRPRSWTDDQLRTAVAGSTRLVDVLSKLGVTKGGAGLQAVRNRILQLGLDVSHMQGSVRSPAWRADPETIRTAGEQRRTWSVEDLQRAVRQARSIAGVLRALNLQVGGSQYLLIKQHIADLGLDTSHFTGKGWARGLEKPTPGSSLPLEAILVENSTYLWTARLRERLIKEGLKERRCEICSLATWMGRPIPLQLDHINGDRRDNRLENLRIVCPNCHAQTDTWCGKNHGRYAE